MKINAATIALVKRWEGCKLTAYQDGGGVWTIGWGTTAAAGLGIAPRAGMKITQAEADELLVRGLEKFADKIRPMFRHEPTDNQFGAFLSLAYNIGPGAFAGSTALRRFNAGDLEGVPAAIRMWNKDNGKVVKGLVNRREDEIKLFLADGPPMHDEPAPPAEPGGFWTALMRLLALIFGGKK